MIRRVVAEVIFSAITWTVLGLLIWVSAKSLQQRRQLAEYDRVSLASHARSVADRAAIRADYVEIRARLERVERAINLGPDGGPTDKE